VENNKQGMQNLKSINGNNFLHFAGEGQKKYHGGCKTKTKQLWKPVHNGFDQKKVDSKTKPFVL